MFSYGNIPQRNQSKKTLQTLQTTIFQKKASIRVGPFGAAGPGPDPDPKAVQGGVVPAQIIQTSYLEQRVAVECSTGGFRINKFHMIQI